MKSFAAAILAAQAISTKAEKFEALSGFGPAEQRLVAEACNPFRVFNVRRYDAPAAYASVDPSYDAFFKLLDALHDRTITGNAAKAAVTATLGLYTETTAAVLARVLNKDLKCGANRGSFEKLYPNLGIPVFHQGLAAKIELDPKAKANYDWRFPCIADAKYDGKRMITFVTDGRVETFARGGNEADYDHLFDAECAKLAELFGQDCVIDGEVYARNFQETTRKDDEARANLRYIVFDLMPLTEWIAQSCPTGQLDRLNRIEKLLEQGSFTQLIKSKYKIVNSRAEAEQFYADLEEEGERTGIEMSEGLIIKRIDGKYDWDPKRRSMVWAKYKPVYDFDVKITGWELGSKGTKNGAIMGRLSYEGEDENGLPLKGKVGGFKFSSPKAKGYVEDLMKQAKVDPKTMSRDAFFRTYVSQHFDEFVGKTMMIEGQMITKAKGSDTYAIRFPQFIMIRDDK